MEKKGNMKNLFIYEINKVFYLFFRSHAHFSKLVSTGLRSTAIFTFFASRSGELIVIFLVLKNYFNRTLF